MKSEVAGSYNSHNKAISIEAVFGVFFVFVIISIIIGDILTERTKKAIITNCYSVLYDRCVKICSEYNLTFERFGVGIDDRTDAHRAWLNCYCSYYEQINDSVLYYEKRDVRYFGGYVNKTTCLTKSI